MIGAPGLAVSRGCSVSPTVFDPTDELLRRRTELNWIWVGGPFGHQPLVKEAIPASIELPQFPIERVRISSLRIQRAHTIKLLRQRRLYVIMCREGLGQKFLALPQRLL